MKTDTTATLMGEVRELRLKNERLKKERDLWKSRFHDTMAGYKDLLKVINAPPFFK